jgi:DNA-binding CsgD family transcriptional regulator/tetratricopeptide (TPR) repeat protein
MEPSPIGCRIRAHTYVTDVTARGHRARCIHTGVTGIVGRLSELAVLRAAVGDAAAGRARAVVIEGEAGIGKTTLVEAVAELADGAGFAVARGAAVELEADRPFGPLVTALDLDPRSSDPRRRALGALVTGRPVASADGGLAATVPETRYRAVDAICGLVDVLAHGRPLALLVEDLHWADEPTLLTLRRLLRATGLPLLTVVTTRPPEPLGPVSSTLDNAVAAGATRVGLGPLGRKEVVALLDTLVGGPAGPRLLALADGAGGNPLFVAELIAVLRQDGNLRAEAGGVEVADGAGTADLARRLRARAARLSAPAGALVRVGAVLGSSFTLDEAARAGGWGVADLLEPLDELLRSGLLVDTGHALTFRHDLFRRAIEDEMPPTARRALHTAAGRALAETGAPPARVARHLALGALAGDEEAVRWLYRAALEVAPRGPATAVGLLDDALALVGAEDPFRLELLTARVEALGWSGRNAEAESLARELLEKIEDRVARLALRRQLALALFVSNRPGDAAEECDRSAAETLDDPGLHAMALAEGALACIAAAQVERAEDLIDSAIRIGRDAGATMAVGLALAVRSRLLAFAGRMEESLAAAREGVRISIGELPRYQPGLFVLFTLHDMDRFDEMAPLLRSERATAEEQGIVWAIPLHHACAANRHYCLGQLGDAHAEATAGLTVAEDSGALLPVAWLHAVLALVALHRNDTAGAESHIASAGAAMAATTPLLGTDLVALAQVRLAEARRDLGGAAATASGAWDLFGAIGVSGGQRNIGLDAMRLAALAGDGDGAARIATRLAELATMTGAASDIATARYAAGVVAGDPDQLVAAVAAFAPGVQPLRQAHVAEEAAKALWSAGRPHEAGAMVERARQIWMDCGATADARRAGELFSSLGIRPPHTPARPTTGWGALTDSERRIVDLVTTGAANASIAEELGISRRTVETHLRHVYAKLDVTSRVQLALEGARRRG